jgi:alkylation response protein AidB-like acyl-CoA dehydrogenase
VKKKASRMSGEFPQDTAAKRKLLLERVEAIAPALRASGPKSEELGTLAPEAVAALRDNGLFRLKLCAELGGAEAEPLTEMLVLEAIAYHDFTAGWCTMVGATSIAGLGAFLTPAGLAQVFKDGHVPTASISVFPAGRVTPDGAGYRVSGRWRFNSGIRHAEWVVGGALVEGSEKGGKPAAILIAMPQKDVTLHDNWGGATGLRGTGSGDCSVENLAVPRDLTFSWDPVNPKPLRGGPGYLLPPFAYVAKEHASVAIGAARRALDELIAIATTTRGTFRASKLDERQVVHRFIGEADLKLRAARALLHERYAALYDKVLAGRPPEAADIGEVRAIAVHATDIAIWIATNTYHFAGNTGLHHPHVLGRLLRDLNTAGLHQVMSDTAYENHGKFRLGLAPDPMS